MYCTIIGFPLKKPRSISIWNNFFKKKKINSKMLAIEISKGKFKKKISKLMADKNFLASAVTMPYKIKIKKFVNKFDLSSKLSESTNLIVKKNNQILAYNTDIYGFLNAVGKNIKLKNVIVIGLGGSGLAIFNYISKKFKNKKFIIITKKNIKDNLNAKFIRTLNFNNLDAKKAYLIINCTPLGSNLKKKLKYKTPLSDNILKKINKSSFVFDLVYKPKKTKLYYQCKKYKIKYTNGIKMNTFQALKALDITSKLTNFKI